jgi:hypothetical protein
MLLANARLSEIGARLPTLALASAPAFSSLPLARKASRCRRLRALARRVEVTGSLS